MLLKNSTIKKIVAFILSLDVCLMICSFIVGDSVKKLLELGKPNAEAPNVPQVAAATTNRLFSFKQPLATDASIRVLV